LTVSTQPGAGTTFNVLLPKVIETEEAFSGEGFSGEGVVSP
jgi:hypothetical protein